MIGKLNNILDKENMELDRNKINKYVTELKSIPTVTLKDYYNEFCKQETDVGIRYGAKEFLDFILQKVSNPK